MDFPSETQAASTRTVRAGWRGACVAPDAIRHVGRRWHGPLLGLPRICAEGPGNPEDRGSLFHAVQITVSEEVSGRVLQAFEPDPDRARLSFDYRGGMFWLRRRTLSGSKRPFRLCSRPNASSPKAARTRSIGSSACM